MHDDDDRTPNEVMAAARAKLRRPEYGQMNRDLVWDEARKVLVRHFTEMGYDVHHNNGEKTVTIIDREPGNPDDRGGSRCVTIRHDWRGTVSLDESWTYREE